MGDKNNLHPRFDDIWKYADYMYYGLPTSVLNVVDGGNWTDMHNRMMTYDTSEDYANWIRPRGRDKVRENVTNLDDDGLQSSGRKCLYRNPYSNQMVKVSTSEFFSRGVTPNVPFVKLGECTNKNVIVVDMNLSALGVPTDPDIIVTIKFTQLEVCTRPYNTRRRKFKCRLITSSTTPITDDNLIDLGTIGKDKYKKIKLSLSTTVTGVATGEEVPNLFHEKGKAATNNVLYYGCIMELEKNLPEDEMSSIRYRLKGHINVKRRKQKGDESKWVKLYREILSKMKKIISIKNT